ncbi:hypothetical protein JCM33374_g2081 [Metschnikowia sp. JCM 33374]|nr:hypothetical protein JCM33374_g2081 [Metschnikowia sp. JCM 33374]
MGSQASKPARKLTGTLSRAGDIGKASAPRIQLPSQALKDRFENSGPEPSVPESANEKAPKTGDHTPKSPTSVNIGGSGNVSDRGIPEGKDGMDPQADQNFIKFINNLGRQIHSHSEGPQGEQVNVRALKQLLNRKQLYKKGQDEVKAQLESPSGSGTAPKSRSMIHPRTLTAIIQALNDPRVSREDIVKDYSVDGSFLENMSRFKVAETLVIIEEDTKPDEIGPKVGHAVPRASTDPTLMNENGSVSETVNQDRLKELRSRLE